MSFFLLNLDWFAKNKDINLSIKVEISYAVNEKLIKNEEVIKFVVSE